MMMTELIYCDWGEGYNGMGYSMGGMLWAMKLNTFKFRLITLVLEIFKIILGCNLSKENEKEGARLIARIISFPFKPKNQTLPNMILKFNSAPSFRDNPFLQNKPSPSSTSTRSTTPPPSSSASTSAHSSKINNKKLWITKNKFEIPSKNTINLYIPPHLGLPPPQLQAYSLLRLQRTL